ncbi:hypothetical protein H310_01725 [Aphanomyces invadans]|uniref:Uncharacterized protein n=1 Tax=Aphanomyces invadans TaxID=157072 RepID=A0A024UUP5_9STRA|nr:hypothetical protein H310_01725 [Aphanomyces invadans]ETW09363.1 hypothetical protein H310_01725 [Aphanomyces invadans]|eukprot:XP_008863168.1 hypothetical protein H310_01725 [Aphanomyces invadans]
MATPRGRSRRDPDPRAEFAVPQPKRICSGVVRVVKTIDPAVAIERALESRSSWRPIHSNMSSPQHSLHDSLDKLSLVPDAATKLYLAYEDDGTMSPRSKSSDSSISSASSSADSTKRRSPSSMLAVIHAPDDDEDRDQAAFPSSHRVPTT